MMLNQPKRREKEREEKLSAWEARERGDEKQTQKEREARR